MKITDIKVRYRRQVKPRDYESAEGELIASVDMTDDADPWKGSAQVMTMLRKQVHAALGIAPPIEDPMLATPVDEAPAQPVEGDPVRERGKPSPGKQRRTRAEMEEDVAADKVLVEADETLAEVEAPVEGETVVTVEGPADTEITDPMLQSRAAKAAQQHGSAKVKDLMIEAGVARLGEMSQEQRTKFVADLDKLGS